MIVLDKLKGYLGVIIVVVAVAGASVIAFNCGSRRSASTVADLSTKLAQNEKTIELKDCLYATKIVEMTSLTGLLDTSQKQVAELKSQLDASQAQLLTTQQLVVRWKQAYEGAVNAHQTDGGQGSGGIVRKRVDFDKDFGPISVTGHTLTDPPEGYVAVTQTRPLKLTVAVARNKDGTWSSYVTSSETNMDVQVALGAVDPGVTGPSWRQRIYLDLGAFALGGTGASVGMSYHFDRWSLGTSCAAWAGGTVGCGLTAGFRIFK